MSKLSVGDVVEVNLDPARGHEQRKIRPCLIINLHPKLDLLTIFPITDAAGKKGRVFVPIKDLKTSGLKKNSVIDTFQIRTLSTDRILRRLGEISKSELFECRRNIALIYEIDEEHLT